MADVTVAFDTLKAATRLQRAGFDEDKARALVSTFAEGMVENFATKQDLERPTAKEELAVLRSETATKADCEMLRTELIRFQDRMTVRMGTAIGAAVAILVAVDKLL